jgi:hypothetical protein
VRARCIIVNGAVDVIVMRRTREGYRREIAGDVLCLLHGIVVCLRQANPAR